MPENTAANDLYPWFDATMRQWHRRVANDRVPNGILLHGPAGTGKSQLALAMAQTLLCQNRDPVRGACNQCQSCHWFNAGTHPDFNEIAPEDKSSVVKIEQIRELCSHSTLTSHAGQYKVTIINPAETMNRSAANAFLKTLEEPVNNTVFILVSHVPGLLPLTIRSRCQAIAVQTPAANQVMQWLKQFNLGNEAYYLSLANGKPLMALEHAKNQSDKIYDQVLQDLLLCVVQKQRDVTETALAWSKQDCSMICHFQLEWVEHLIREKMQANTASHLVPAHAQQLSGLNVHMNLSLLFKIRDCLINTLSLLNTSVNKQLLLEALLIQWRDSSDLS